MPSLDGEYRRHPRPEYRLHYSGDVGRLLVGYDKVCRFVNVRTIEEALAARLKDHQSPADGKQDEPTLSRLDLSGVVVPGSHVHALVCAILARGPELRPPGITALTTLVLDGCRIGDHGVAEIATRSQQLCLTLPNLCWSPRCLCTFKISILSDELTVNLLSQ